MAVLWISPDVQEINAPWIKSVLHEAGFKRAKSPIQHETTVRLNLNAPLDQIIAQMEKRRREDIRKYEREKQNWATGWSTSRDSLNTLYSLHKTTMLRVQRQPKGFEYLSKICEYLGPNRSCLIFVVDYNGQPAASIFLLGTSKRLWAVYGGSDRRVVSDADVAVHWEIIKWAHQHGYQEYDLQGFPDEVERDNPLYGIYLFKRGWGGQVVILIGEYTYAPVPGMLGILNWLLRKMRMVI
jgi:lipid II:glycine glycyltransferase (peptidoglycan interpeptide bridge formation enzyme)